MKHHAIRGAAVLVTLLMTLGPVTGARADNSGNSGSTDAQFSGVIESLPATGLIGDWVVSGTTVHVTDATEIDTENGAIAVGATVDVEGTAETDGSVTASQVSVQSASDDDSFGEVSFYGTVESMPASGSVGDWVVSGTTVHVTDATEINTENGVLGVGSSAEVQGLAESDGSVTASSIDLNSDSSISDGTMSLTGTLQSAPAAAGIWRVSHHRVRVTRATTIVRHGHQLTRGSTLRIQGHLRAGGTLNATKVIVRR